VVLFTYLYLLIKTNNNAPTNPIALKTINDKVQFSTSVKTLIIFLACSETNSTGAFFLHSILFLTSGLTTEYYYTKSS